MSLGNRDIFLWESVPCSLQATRCVRNKKAKQRGKVKDFFSWLGERHFFSKLGKGNVKMPVKEQEQSGPSDVWGISIALALLDYLTRTLLYH